jgi:small subunit ribosomal protein S16
MVKIRLTRGGAKKRPFYRVVAIDERDKRDGRALEFLGTYDPKSKPPLIKLDVAHVEAWVGKGAQLSDSVRSILKQARQAAKAAGGAA